LLELSLVNDIHGIIRIVSVIIISLEWGKVETVVVGPFIIVHFLMGRCNSSSS
jgi:hypothetical protein